MPIDPTDTCDDCGISIADITLNYRPDGTTLCNQCAAKRAAREREDTAPEESLAIKISWQDGLVEKRGFVCEFGTERRIIDDGLDTEYIDEDAPNYKCATGLTWEAVQQFIERYRDKARR